MKKTNFFLSALAFVLFFACSFEGANNSKNSGGSISFYLTSASVATSGQPAALENVASYKVIVRNSDNVAVQTASAAPGTSVVINDLYPGLYSVAVQGLDSSSKARYYGAAKNILVAAGQTSNAALTLRAQEECFFNFSLEEKSVVIGSNCEPSLSDIGYVYIKHSCSALGTSGEVFYGVPSGDTAGLDALNDQNSLKVGLDDFLEPGYEYNFEAFVFSGNINNYEGVVLWSGKFSAVIEEKNGAIGASLSCPKK